MSVSVSDWLKISGMMGGGSRQWAALLLLLVSGVIRETRSMDLCETAELESCEAGCKSPLSEMCPCFDHITHHLLPPMSQPREIRF